MTTNDEGSPSQSNRLCWPFIHSGAKPINDHHFENTVTPDSHRSGSHINYVCV